MVLSSLFAALLLAFCGGGCGSAARFLDPDRAERGGDTGSVGEERSGSAVAYEHLIRGEIWRTRGDFARAVKELKKAVTADPDDFYLRIRLAQALGELGKHEQAGQQLARVLEKDQSNELAWLTLAQLHQARGHDQRAEAAAKAAIRAEPLQVEATLWLAELYESGGKQRKAAELLQRAVELAPQNAQVRIFLGRLSLAQGNNAEAMRHLERFLELRPDRSDGVAALAQAHLAAGQPREAARLFELALEHSTPQEPLREQLIDLLLEQGLVTSARKHLDSLTMLSDPTPAELDHRTCQLSRAGRPYAARRSVIDAYGTAPIRPEIRLILVELELTLGRFEVARRLLEEQGPSLTDDEQRARAQELRQAATGSSSWTYRCRPSLPATAH